MRPLPPRRRRSAAFVFTAVTAFIPIVHAQWNGLGVSGGSGNGTFNDSANWVGGTINGSFVNNTSTATITLSADQAITGAGLTVGNATGTQPIVTTIDGTAGGALEILTISGSVQLNKSAALSPSITGTGSSGSNSLTVSSASGLAVGQLVSGTGIPAGTYITGIAGTTVTLSRNTNAALSGTALTVASGLVLGSELQLELGGSDRTFNANVGSGANAGVIVANSLISGTGGIVIGGGALWLTNASNSFTGAIGSSGSGNVFFTSGGALGAGTAGITVNNSSLNYAGSTALTISRALSNFNSGAFNNSSSGGASSNVTLSGNVSLAGGTLSLGGSNSAAVNEVSGVVSGAGGLQAGGGTWRLSNAGNTFNGTVAANGGTLQFTNAGSLGGPASGVGNNIDVNNSTLQYVGNGTTTITNRNVRIVNTGTILNNNALAADNLVISSNVTNDGGNRTMVLTGSNAGNNTISGVIADNNPTTAILTLNKTGAGIWRLTNSANTFSGQISVSQGTLQFTTAGSLGLGNASLTVNNAALGYAGNGTVTTTTRPITIVNTGTLRNDNALAADNWVVANAIIPDAGARTMNLAGSNSGANEITGLISNGGSGGSISIFKTGGGTWLLSNNNNSFNGSVTGDSGTLQYTTVANSGTNSALGAGSSLTTNNYNLSFVGSTAQSTNRTLSVFNTGDLGANGASPNATVTFSGNVSINNGNTLRLRGANVGGNTLSGNIGASTGNLQKLDAGTWVLSGTNSYNGTTTVSGGVLRLASANALPGGIGAAGGTSALTISGGVVELANGDFTRGLGTGASQVNLAFGGFSASGGNRSVNLGGASASVTWGAGNFATGGELQLSSAVSNATIDFQNPIDLGTTGANTRTIQVNNGSANVDAIVSGVLSNSGGTQALTKTGSGTLALTNSNTYSGTTTVSAGTLLVNNTTGSGTGTGSVVVSSGATLGGTGTIGGATSVTGRIAPGISGIGTLNINNTVTWNGAASAGSNTNWTFDLSGGSSAADRLSIVGNFTKNTGTGTVFAFDFGATAAYNTTFVIASWTGSTNFGAGDFSYVPFTDGLTGTFNINGSQLEFITAVPEPSTWALLSTAALGLAILARRRAKRKASC